eukprot:120024_1
MMTIIIELFSFLFWARSVYGGTSSEPCKVSTHNTNDYMHPDYLGVTEFLVDPTNVGCGQTEFKWRDGGSATILTPISCDAVGENYVINSIIYASLGMVAGSCGELNYPYVPPTDVKEQDAPSWCIEEENNYEYICCFGDDEYFINIPDEIGQECIGESECEISVWSWGLSIERKLVTYDFSDDENAILTRIQGPWGLKVLFECGPVTVSTSAPESEYSEYKFDL